MRMKILAICGSLRATSTNAALLRIAARLAPPEVQVTLSTNLGELPLFNPDFEIDPPASVLRLRAQVATADALMIASPEYAHGVTGTIKNALDWLVSFEAFADKPVAVLNASPRSHHADDALRETLKTMSAMIVKAASVGVPLTGSSMTESDMVALPSITQPLMHSLEALRQAVSQHQRPGPVFSLDP
jgi:chromate reductase, NAD(P)H dehydrogenase (quinone)